MPRSSVDATRSELESEMAAPVSIRTRSARSRHRWGSSTDKLELFLQITIASLAIQLTFAHKLLLSEQLGKKEATDHQDGPSQVAPSGRVQVSGSYNMQAPASSAQAASLDPQEGKTLFTVLVRPVKQVELRSPG